jgi:hypothetical protein
VEEGEAEDESAEGGGVALAGVVELVVCYGVCLCVCVRVCVVNNSNRVD